MPTSLRILMSAPNVKIRQAICFVQQKIQILPKTPIVGGVPETMCQDEVKRGFCSWYRHRSLQIC